MLGFAVSHVAVVMPAHDEEGLGGFIDELERHLLAPGAVRISFWVVDDTSSFPLPVGVAAAGGSPVTVVRNERNLGHGPSALRSYALGLGSGADLVLHVDGDGQIDGADAARLVANLVADPCAAAVVGVRTSRHEPWYRRSLSTAARLLAGVGPDADANSPMRAYRPGLLREHLAAVAVDSRVPHLHFARAEHGREDVAHVPVAHRARRGVSRVGTMWGPGARSHRLLPPRTLVRFAMRAARELLAAPTRGSVPAQAPAVVAPVRPDDGLTWLRAGAGV